MIINKQMILPRRLIAILILLLAYSNTLKVDAGKGKGGRQGHIIVQNEVKGNQLVPIYMPIPIPIPMSMAPHPQPKSHHGQHQIHSDGEDEIKKIYLLQPMTKFQPQPNFNGGSGFVSPPPVQNHIHLEGQSMRPRFSPKPSSYGDHFDDHHHHNHLHNNHHHSDHKSEVKVLPIVVIPPIQMYSGSHQPAVQPMTFKPSPPQINNYVMDGSERRRQSYQAQDQQSFADYGGSLGGATFRSASLAARQARQQRPRSRHFGRDEPMDDSDFGPSSWRPATSGPRRGPLTRVSRGGIQRRHPTSSVLFDDDLGEQQGRPSRRSPHNGDYGTYASPSNLDEFSERNQRVSVQRASQALDSVDERPNQRNHQNQHQTDLSSLYYDHDSPGALSERVPGRIGSEARNLPAASSLDVNGYNSGDAFEDEWRFDTIKSVVHASPGTSSTNITSIRNLTQTDTTKAPIKMSSTS